MGTKEIKQTVQPVDAQPVDAQPVNLRKVELSVGDSGRVQLHFLFYVGCMLIALLSNVYQGMFHSDIPGYAGFKLLDQKSAAHSGESDFPVPESLFITKFVSKSDLYVFLDMQNLNNLPNKVSESFSRFSNVSYDTVAQVNENPYECHLTISENDIYFDGLCFGATSEGDNWQMPDGVEKVIFWTGTLGTTDALLAGGGIEEREATYTMTTINKQSKSPFGVLQKDIEVFRVLGLGILQLEKTPDIFQGVPSAIKMGSASEADVSTICNGRAGLCSNLELDMTKTFGERYFVIDEFQTFEYKWLIAQDSLGTLFATVPFSIRSITGESFLEAEYSNLIIDAFWTKESGMWTKYAYTKDFAMVYYSGILASLSQGLAIIAFIGWHFYKSKIGVIRLAANMGSFVFFQVISIWYGFSYLLIAGSTNSRLAGKTVTLAVLICCSSAALGIFSAINMIDRTIRGSHLSHRDDRFNVLILYASTLPPILQIIINISKEKEPIYPTADGVCLSGVANCDDGNYLGIYLAAGMIALFSIESLKHYFQVLKKLPKESSYKLTGFEDKCVGEDIDYRMGRVTRFEQRQSMSTSDAMGVHGSGFIRFGNCLVRIKDLYLCRIAQLLPFSMAKTMPISLTCWEIKGNEVKGGTHKTLSQFKLLCGVTGYKAEDNAEMALE